MPEIGRAVVRKELAAGGDALPWGDERAFADKMWPREIAAHADALRLGTTVILDRGVPDVVGFLRAAEAAMRETYAGYGYVPVDLPRVPVEEQVAFVLDRLGV